MKKINYIIGNKNFSTIPFEPFSKKICNFLNDFSIILSKFKNIKKYPDLKSLAFWCRKKNILKLKLVEKNLTNKIGLGLAFHITPSNIPTNFAYSLIFGLLSGNSNVVKVPSRNFNQIDIICSIIKKLLKKHSFLKRKINIVRYQDNDEASSLFSNLCNARIIWGGDNTINKIRNFKIKERTVELAFADRYSFCILNTNKIIKLNDEHLGRLVEKFYNDTYAVDQNACTSPHLIIWLGKKSKQVKKIFWDKLYSLVKSKYDFLSSFPIEKFSKICEQIATQDNINSIKSFENLIYAVQIKKLQSNNHLIRGKLGTFFELHTNSLNVLKKIINNKYQTLIYYGIDSEILKKFILKNNLQGVDRIVPLGQSLNIGLIWDGYNIIDSLTRTIEVQ